MGPAGKHTDNLAAPRLHVAPSPQPSRPSVAVRRLWPRCLRSFPALRGTRTAVGVPVAVAERNGLLRRRRLVRRSRLNVRTSECGWFEDDMSSYQGATGASGT